MSESGVLTAGGTVDLLIHGKLLRTGYLRIPEKNENNIKIGAENVIQIGTCDIPLPISGGSGMLDITISFLYADEGEKYSKQGKQVPISVDNAPFPLLYHVQVPIY